MTFSFPTGIEIPANGLLLLVAINPDDFRSKYLIPAEVPVVGPFTGSLSNSSDALGLFKPGTPNTDSTGAVVVPKILVDAVTYLDHSPWPNSADGGGPALERINASAYGNDPANWRASVSGGTPGRLPSMDHDNDGMNDDVDPDDDNDGVMDVDEKIAGTNPFDANSKPGGTADFDGDGMTDDVDTDDDNDGVSDQNEIADGTDPYDANSFLRVPLTLKSLAGKVTFSGKTAGSGSCSVQGSIVNLAAGFNPDQQDVTVNIGGAAAVFKMGPTGASKTVNGTFALSVKHNRKPTPRQARISGRVDGVQDRVQRRRARRGVGALGNQSCVYGKKIAAGYAGGAGGERQTLFRDGRVCVQFEGK